MEQESAAVWFYTYKGERFGPVALDELKRRVTSGELDPLSDLVWQKGMPNWTPLGEVRGLFSAPVPDEEPAAPAAAVEPAATVQATAPQPATPAPTATRLPEPRPAPAERKPTSGPNALEPIEVKESPKSAADLEWPGARRRSYLFAILVLPVLINIGAGFLSTLMAAGDTPSAAGSMLALGASLLVMLIGIVFTLMRLSNLGMSRWWYFGFFVPLLNLWVGFRCFACPAGYASHKKMDGIGIMLAILYWLMVLVMLAVLAGVVMLGFMLATDPATLEQFRQALAKNPELQQMLLDLLQQLEPPTPDAPAP